MASSPRPFHRIEHALLCIFAIALPLVEAPKNIALALFLLVWMGRSIQMRNFGSCSKWWSAALAGVLGAAVLSQLFSPFPNNPNELSDITGYLALAWIIGRSQLTAKQVTILLASFIGATLLGLAHGYWIHYTKNTDWLQLNSVGHVNHSAAYGACIAVAAQAFAAAFWLRASRFIKALLALLTITLLAVMFTWGSRGALLTYLFGSVIFTFCFWRASKIRLWPVVLLCVISAASALATAPLVIQRTQDTIRDNRILSFRVEGFNVALETLRHYPITGVGAANYNDLSPELVQKWVEARGAQFDRDKYLFSSHAHTLYGTTLTERGLLGFAALMVLIGLWLRELIVQRPKLAPRDAAGSMHWMIWGAALAGWATVSVGGLFNTMLHHEHGMLAMCFLGLLLSRLHTQERHASVA